VSSVVRSLNRIKLHGDVFSVYSKVYTLYLFLKRRRPLLCPVSVNPDSQHCGTK
jgi:hypothetical protein